MKESFSCEFAKSKKISIVYQSVHSTSRVFIKYIWSKSGKTEKLRSSCDDKKSMRHRKKKLNLEKNEIFNV